MSFDKITHLSTHHPNQYIRPFQDLRKSLYAFFQEIHSLNPEATTVQLSVMRE